VPNKLLCILALASCLSLPAAELKLDFASLTPGSYPTGFVSTVSGLGKPGKWEIVSVDAPSAFAPLTPLATGTSKINVLAQTDRDPTDEHFPLLVHAGEEFDDFTMTTRLRCEAGKVEQMAGVVFRYQDEKNYYVIRASALGNSLRFYKFVNGLRSPPIGPEINIPSGIWHEITVTCAGNTIRCDFNGDPGIPTLTDNSFVRGKIGFWTKSDSVSYFADARINYTPRVSLATRLVAEFIEDRPSVENITLYIPKGDKRELTATASGNAEEIGQGADKTTTEVFEQDAAYYDRGSSKITVMVALHDRNGDAVALIKVVSKRFFGETQNTSVFRARKIAESMESRFTDGFQLTE
jgi:hypothetical protein